MKCPLTVNPELLLISEVLVLFFFELNAAFFDGFIRDRLNFVERVK